MRTRNVTIVLLIVALTVSSALSSSIEYEQIPFPPVLLYNFGAAIDSHRNKLVVFGGTRPGGQVSGDTWIYDLGAKKWNKFKKSASPPARILHALAYLPSTKNIVLFGGKDQSGRYLNDTWKFNGKKWKKVNCPALPNPRGIPAVSASSKGNQIVMFGGFSPTGGDLKDTWLFNGKKWIEVTTQSSPSGRSAAAMAPHSQSGGVLLYGGLGAGSKQEGNLVDLKDTWVFDSGGWKQIETLGTLGPRSNHCMASDPSNGRIFLLGGSFEGNPVSDFWVFENNNWERPDSAFYPLSAGDSPILSNLKTMKIYCLSPPSRSETSDPDPNALAFLDDTWTFDGKQWTQLKLGISPIRRCYTSLAYDSVRHVAVLFGGSTSGFAALDDTWEFDGKNWKRIQLSTAPPSRYDHKMVFDQKRSRITLFGGFGKEGKEGKSLNDTWTYDGQKWDRLSLATNPTARSRHAITYDEQSGRIWLFGGYDKLGNPTDGLWYFDGTDWTKEELVSLHPAPRSSATMVCNPKESALYLFGGFAKDHGMFQDTWKYDLQNHSWELIPTKNAPAARQDAGFVYDDSSGALILFGGFDGKTDLSDTWMFSKGKWNKLDIQGPIARSYFGMTFDKKNGRALIFGGYGLGALSQATNDKGFSRIEKPGTWEFDGRRWGEIATAQRPAADLSYAMAYDLRRKITVLFGGYNETLGELDQTWIYNGKKWTLVPATSKPGKRTNASLIYDPKRKKVLCYGGYNSESGPLNDMWEFDGKNWKKLAVNCPISNFTGGSSMVYDEARKVFVYYGGRKQK